MAVSLKYQIYFPFDLAIVIQEHVPMLKPHGKRFYGNVIFIENQKQSGMRKKTIK